MTINKTEKFKLRKSKKYKNLVSVGLGVMTAVAIGVASDNEAYASDQMIGNATNSTTTQPPANKVQSDNLANTNTSTGAVNINIDNSNVRNAVNKAKSEGVNVVEKTQDLGVTTSTEETTRKRNEAIEQNKAEENKINEVINNYKKEKEANQNAINTATSENREKQAQYEKDLANYNKEKAEIENFNNNARAENKRKTDEYNNRVADINRENETIRNKNSEKEADYNKNIKKYEKAVAEIERMQQEVKTTKPLLAQSGGIAVYGNYNFAGAGSTDFYKDLTIVEDDKITDTTELVDGIQWRANTEVEKISGNFSQEVLWAEYPKWYALRYIETGDKFKIKNVGTTVDGRNVNMEVTTLVGTPSGQVINGEPVSEQRMTVSYGTDNSSIYFDYGNMENISLTFKFVDDNNNLLRLGLGTLVGDVDYGQGSKLEFSDSSKMINPPGSELIEKNRIMWSSPDSGNYLNLASTPKGTYLTIGYGDSVTYSHYNSQRPISSVDRINVDQEIATAKNKGNGYGPAFSLFGKSAELKKIPTIPLKPNLNLTPEKPLPESPRLETLKEEPPKPEKPTPKPIPSEVTAPTVGYTSFRLAERPRVFKEARNLDNINLDNSLVSKNSTVKFTLKVDKLPAGREALNVLEFTDHLPQGYVIDEATVTRENNALGYNTAYDKANHTVVFSANTTLLNKLNANLNEVVDVVAPTVTGTVTNDGGIYKNNFKINLNNKYTTHSNVVTVNTPNSITPNKVNTNADNSNIDGKIVVAETTNYYKLLWDLDQYRGMKLSRNDIAKGFYYLEDYPEEAVTINNRLVSLVDSNGQAVTGVEVNSYNNLENAPENVKTMLSKANITPKGAFQLFTATNPTDFYNKYVVTGNSIKITNPMVVKDSLTQTGGVYENKAYQIDLGNGYATETVRNIVPKVDTNKHNYNEDGVLIDGKQVVAGTTNHYKLLWDLDQYRGMSATNSEIARGFFFVEDYPEEALTIDNSKVTMVDSKGQAVTGVEVSSYNSLENAPGDVKKLLGDIKLAPKGAFQLFKATNAKDFFNKYVLTGKSITITTPMKVKEELTTTGGTYNNKAYQVDFGKTFETNIVTNIVPKVTPEKHNTNEDGTVIDGKQIVAGTTNYYKLTWDLTPYRGVVPTRNELNKGFFFVEDYPEKEVTIDNSKVTMVDSKGQAVTGVEVSSYNSLEEAPENVRTMLSKANISPKGAFQLFNASSPEDFFNKYASVGNSITITTPMTVKEELTTTGGTIRNKGYQIDFGKGRETEIITNEIPKVTPEKHNTNEDGVVVDGKQVVAGTTNHYKLTWDLDQYRDMTATSREVARGFFVVEDYPEEALTIDNSKVTMVDSNGQAVTGVEVLSYDSVENAPDDIKKSLTNAKIAPKGAFQLFRATNARDFFNKYVLTGNSITITTPMTVKEELTTTGGVFNNKMYQVDFGKGREVEHEVTNNIPKVEPTKHNTNKDGVVIDGKVIAPETVNNYKLLWDLDQYKGVVATSRELAKGFYFVEDYPEEALAINNSKVTMIDSKGQAVTGVEVLSYDSVENAPDDIKKALVNAKITPKGAFQVYKATNSREFYDKYVFTGNSITITSPMTMLDSVNKNGAVYNNKAYQIDFGKGRETDVVTNTVPKSNPEKHNYNEDGVLIDGGLVPVGSTTEYKLTWKLSNLRDVVGTNEAINRGFYYIDDYPEVLKTLDDRIKVLDSNGNVVNGIRVTKYDNLEQASNEVKAILSKNNITPKGAFQVFSAENPTEFYNNYVKKGIDLTIVNPMQVTQVLKENGGSYQNVAYEIDFGVAQVTDTITNTVPKVKPVKHNYNEDNVKIDGKVVLAASRTNYKLNWNLSAYKNVEASDKYIKKGFYFVDDYPEEALNLDEKNITITDDKGKAVVGVEVVNYESLEKAPEEVKAVLKEAKVTPKGAFQLFKATDSKQFYNDYVKTGTNLTITNPMTVKPELARKDSKKVVDNNSKETENKTIKDVTKVNNSVTTTKIKPEVDKAINEAVERENNTLNTISKVSTGNTEKEKGKDTKGTEKTTEYKNRGYQIDFGNGYETDVVANNVPKIDPIKDVVIDVKGKESLQGKEIELNKLFNYKLIGTEIPSNRGTKLTQYGFSDDYDEKADKYQANYRVFSMKDIKLTDGSIIKQDSELTKYTTQIMTDGKVDIEFDKEFLDKIDLDSEFQAEVYLQMERIASGEVKNTFIHTVNGVEEISNTVTTFTKEPEKPVEPEKPEEPKQSVPPKVEEKTPNKSTGKVLPNTGVADNDGTSTAIALTALATAGFIARRKKVRNS